MINHWKIENSETHTDANNVLAPVTYVCPQCGSKNYIEEGNNHHQTDDLRRDCDGTPLYSLSFDKNWKPDMFGEQFKTFARWAVDSGYSEDSLKVVS